MTLPEHSAADDLRFWLLTRRILQVVLAIGVFFAVWFVGFRTTGEPAVLPDTSEQFSLDMEVVASADHDVVYAVEQRARPAYRIFSFDPATGRDETIFTVPEDAIVYGIALHPDRSSLAVAYSTSFEVEGNGIWILDLDTLEFDELTPTVDGVYLTELEWGDAGDLIYATHVDRRTDTEQLSVAAIDAESGAADVILTDAITPAPASDVVYYLAVDSSQARRSVGVLGADGITGTIEILDGERDLDHLTLLGGESQELAVAVLEDQDDAELSFGTPAAAHGNHNIQSSWWTVAPSASTPEAGTTTATGIEPIIVYDAAASDSGSIVYATLEGLSLTSNGQRVDLIESRAIRFVAA